METITTETELERAGFKWRENEEGVRALVCAPLEREGFANAFSTRGGGVSPFPENSLNLAGFDQDSAENIRENRRRFMSLLGEGWTLAACWQVHGSDVRVVRDAEDTQSEREHCDALTTRAPGVPRPARSGRSARSRSSLRWRRSRSSTPLSRPALSRC